MENENIVVDENEEEVQEAEQEPVESKEEEKKFTQDEVNKIIQDRLAKEKIKNEKAQEEAKKLAKMNADEKAKYEIEKAKEELAKREAEVTKRELTAEAKSILSEKGLSVELHSLLNYESAESVQDSINVLVSSIQKETEKAVEERLKGNPPKKSTGIAGITREDIMNISNPIERQRKIAENIELFN